MRFSGDVFFVTGGSGFIGSAVIRHLLNDTTAAVVNIDKQTYASSPDTVEQFLRNPRYQSVQVDICDSEKIRELFEKFCPRFLLNLAAESHVDRSIDSPKIFVETNVVGTFTLLEEALRYWRKLSPSNRTKFRFHHVSTDEVYGSLESSEQPFLETSPYSPNSPYAASKASSDHLVRAWNKTYELPTVVTNCSNNFGPFQFPEKLIPHMIIRALSRQELPVYGDGRNVRDWIYVEDHARALIATIERGEIGGTYNIGGNSEHENIEVVTSICRLLDDHFPENGPHAELIRFVQDRPGHDRRYAIDANKIKNEIGWAPSESFESGLNKTVGWYVQNRPWWERILKSGYSAMRLGSQSNL